MNPTVRQILPPALAMSGIVLVSNILVQFPINPWLTWGAFSYPVAYFVTDVCNRTSGPALARRVAWVGFAVRLRLQSWWKAPLFGSAAASVVDTSLFFGVAFAGTDVPWLPLAGGDLGVKLFMALALLPPYRLLVARLTTAAPSA
ncbi:MAG: hypothetical protein CFE45_34935 [Burkholderiales bacterium PBB5]|nr:MAG: hypothetical protein CFE45_34935 [Burkholderiales bacterium PBB5]